MVPRNSPYSPQKRPGLIKKTGKCVPKSGRYDCIFMQKRCSFCINIQSCVKTFRNRHHDHSNDRVRDTRHDGHGQELEETGKHGGYKAGQVAIQPMPAGRVLRPGRLSRGLSAWHQMCVLPWLYCLRWFLSA